jgi:putative phosphoesterase
MIRIGLLSDSHNYLHPQLFDFFEPCKEIWHAGDIGSIGIADELNKFRPLRAVYGNIDGTDVRTVYSQHNKFMCEKVTVWMTHIGGYPGNYASEVRNGIMANPPRLFISGHSHILKVMNDKKLGLLHINPGAAGKSGLHKVITFVRFIINDNRIYDLEIMEIER